MYKPQPWRECLIPEVLERLNSIGAISLTEFKTTVVIRNGRRVLKLYGKELKVKHKDNKIETFGFIVH